MTDFLFLLRLLVFEHIARMFVWKNRTAMTLFLLLVIPTSMVIPAVQFGGAISTSGPPGESLARLFSLVLMFGCPALLFSGFAVSFARFERPLGPDEDYLWRITDPSRSWMLGGALLIRGWSTLLVLVSFLQTVLVAGLIQSDGVRLATLLTGSVDALLWFSISALAGAFLGQSLQARIELSRLKTVYYVSLVVGVLILAAMIVQVGAVVLGHHVAGKPFTLTNYWGRAYADHVRTGGVSGKVALASIRVFAICLLGYGLTESKGFVGSDRSAQDRVRSGLRTTTRRWQAFLVVQALNLRRRPSKFLKASLDTFMLAGLLPFLLRGREHDAGLLGLALLFVYGLFRVTLFVAREMGTEQSLVLLAKRAPNCLLWYLLSKWALAWFVSSTVVVLLWLWGLVWLGKPVVGLLWVVFLCPPAYSLVATGFGARFGYYKDSFTGMTFGGLVAATLTGTLLSATVPLLITVSGLVPEAGWALGFLAAIVWGVAGFVALLLGLRRLGRLEI